MAAIGAAIFIGTEAIMAQEQQETVANPEVLIGMVAGKVWEVLVQKGPQSPDTIARNTKLKGGDVDLAIGWLARENKLNIHLDSRGKIGKIALKS